MRTILWLWGQSILVLWCSEYQFGQQCYCDNELPSFETEAFCTWEESCDGAEIMLGIFTRVMLARKCAWVPAASRDK